MCQEMPRRSRVEIEKWESIVSKFGQAGIERLRGYTCSLMLGRDFCETAEAYFERQGITQFYEWAQEIYAKAN